MTFELTGGFWNPIVEAACDLTFDTLANGTAVDVLTGTPMARRMGMGKYDTDKYLAIWVNGGVTTLNTIDTSGASPVSGGADITIDNGGISTDYPVIIGDGTGNGLALMTPGSGRPVAYYLTIDGSDNVTVVLGSEDVTNGDFPTDSTGWTEGTGWSHSGSGSMSCDGTQVADTDLTQDITAVAENFYVVTFDVANHSAGNVTAVVGDTEGTDRGGNGTFTQSIRCGAGSDIDIRGDVDFVGDIDNVSVKLEGVALSASAGDNVLATRLASGKFVCAYNANSALTAHVVDLSDGVPNVNAGFNYQAQNTGFQSITDISATQVLVTYQDISANNFQGVAQVLDISSTTVTGNAGFVFETNSVDNMHPESLQTLNSTTFIQAYQDADNSDFGTIQVLTRSGGTMAGGNTPLVYKSADTQHNTVAVVSECKAVVCYDASADHLALIIEINSNTPEAKGSELVFDTTDAGRGIMSAMADSGDDTRLMTLRNTDAGTAEVLVLSTA